MAALDRINRGMGSETMQLLGEGIRKTGRCGAGM